MTRNGARVTTRYSSTRGRAASAETLKKIDPAIETTKNDSAALCTQCVIVSRDCRAGPSNQSRNDPPTRDRFEALCRVPGSVCGESTM